jgi:hypothetical protein
MYLCMSQADMATCIYHCNDGTVLVSLTLRIKTFSGSGNCPSLERKRCIQLVQTMKGVLNSAESASISDLILLSLLLMFFEDRHDPYIVGTIWRPLHVK